MLKRIFLVFYFLVVSAFGNPVKIAVIVGGGDCSGVNSVCYALTKKASKSNFRVIGVKRGIYGFLQNEFVEFDEQTCSTDWLYTAGSIIKTGAMGAKDRNGRKISEQKAIDALICKYNSFKFSGIVYIGSCDDIKIARKIVQQDPAINLVFIPKTIDNDIAQNDRALGFMTAVKVVSHELRNIIDTARTHGRVMVVEVMGKCSGHISLLAGIASGADAILIPERKVDLNALEKKVQRCYASGQNYALIIISEAVKYDFQNRNLNKPSIAESFSAYFDNKGFESRAVVLGHAQRGGTTCVEDRILAQKLAVAAIDTLKKGRPCSQILLNNEGQISGAEIANFNGLPKLLDSRDQMLKLASDLNIYTGEAVN